jgi:hypothetical protein
MLGLATQTCTLQLTDWILKVSKLSRSSKMQKQTLIPFPCSSTLVNAVIAKTNGKKVEVANQSCASCFGRIDNAFMSQTIDAYSNNETREAKDLKRSLECAERWN